VLELSCTETRGGGPARRRLHSRRLRLVRARLDGSRHRTPALDAWPAARRALALLPMRGSTHCWRLRLAFHD